MQVLVHVDGDDQRWSHTLLPRLPLDMLGQAGAQRAASHHSALEVAHTAAQRQKKGSPPIRRPSPPGPAWPSARAVEPSVAALVSGRLPGRQQRPLASSAPASFHGRSDVRLRYPPEEAAGHEASRAMLPGVAEASEQQQRSIAQIEALLQRELAALNEHPSAGPTGPRLAAFRSAFQEMIGQFRFMGPILSAVKREYDEYIASLEGERSRLLAIGAREATVRLTAEAERERAERRREVAELRAALAAQKKEAEEAARRVAEAEALAEERLEEYRRADANYQDWRRANGSLMSMVAHYERMFEETEASRIKEAKEAEAAFRLAAESQAQVRLLLEEIERVKHLMESHGREAAAAATEENKREIQRLHRVIGTTKLQLKAVETQYDELLVEHRETVREVEMLASTLRDGALPIGLEGPEAAAKLGPLQAALGGIRGRLTPRPDWGGVKARVPALDVGEPPRGTVALLNDLVYLLEKAETRAALAGSGQAAVGDVEREPMPADEEEADLGAAKEYVEALGTGASVPRYLRWAGKVRNRKLPKRETELLIRDCWSSKFVYERSVRAAKGAPTPMSEYFYTYLQKRFGIQAMIAEYGYSVVDALQRYGFDADIDLFRRVLQGELSEEVYADQLDMIERLRQMCIKLDRNQAGGKETGVVNKKTLLAALRKFFPHKSEGDYRELCRMLDGEQAGPDVVYFKLFQEDRNYNQGPFMELLRSQYIRDIQSYTAQVEGALLALPRDADGMVTVAAVRAALAALDPERPPRSMDEVLARGLGPELADVGLLYEGTAVDPARVVRNLRLGILKKAVRGETREKPEKEGKGRGKKGAPASVGAGMGGTGGLSGTISRDEPPAEDDAEDDPA